MSRLNAARVTVLSRRAPAFHAAGAKLCAMGTPVTRSQHSDVAAVTACAELVTHRDRPWCAPGGAITEVDPTPTNVHSIDRCLRSTRCRHGASFREPARRADL